VIYKRERGKMKTILIISDMHCGHVFGLTDPKWDVSAPDDAEREVTKPIAIRKALWSWFDHELASMERPDVLIVNGDAIEGKGERSGGTELLTSDRHVQVDMAASVIRRVRARRVFMTYGTAAHVGKEEDFEATLRDKVGAEKIEAEGHYAINGLNIACKHYIGNSASPMSKTTAMNGAQIRQTLWSIRGQQPRANLIVRSHIHRCYGVIEPGTNWAGWTTPGLQGLGTKYGARAIDGLPVDFGFLVVHVNSESSWDVEPHVAPCKLQQAAVTKL
jgi:hypothetical protein